MLRCSLFGLVMAMAAQSFAAEVLVLRDDAPEHVKRYVAKCEKGRTSAELAKDSLVELRREITAVKAGRIDARVEAATLKPVEGAKGRDASREVWHFRDLEQKKAKLAEVEEKIKAAQEAARGPGVPTVIESVILIGDGANAGPIEVGAIGRVDFVTVNQVISETAMIGTRSETVTVPARYWESAGGGRQLIAPASRHTVRIGPLWFEGIDTSRFVDGRMAELHQVFEVTGTKQYETVLGGSTTVFVLKPFDLSKFMQPLDKSRSSAQTAPQSLRQPG